MAAGRFEIRAVAAWEAESDNDGPDVSFVPPLARRRLTGVERAALAVAWKVRSEGDCPVVFASRWGEIGVTLKLMRQLHDEGEMSPAGFSASVHNAAAGAFSLLTGNRAGYTAVAAGERSIEAGLLEALGSGRETVFVYAEEKTPDFYVPEFIGTAQKACALAVRLCPADDGCVEAVFRREKCPPLGFAAARRFFEGGEGVLATGGFVLSRRRG